MADGRELFYFDDVTPTREVLPDTRDLPHVTNGSTMRYDVLTGEWASLITQAEAHRQQTGRDLLGDVLDAERKSGARIVLDGEAWTCFVPAAARWPVEAHLVPHRAVPDIAALNDAERDELAVLYRELLHRLERVFGEPMELPYIAGWHQAPGAARTAAGADG